MSWNGNVKIHNVPGTGYPGQPAIYAYVTVSDITRNNNTLSCKVSASLNKMGKYSYFGYYIRLYAQLDNGNRVQLFYKPNSPSTWADGVYKGEATLTSTNNTTTSYVNIYFQSNCGGECKGSPNPYKMYAIRQSAPPLPAPTITLSSTGFTSNTLSWNATSNYDCDKWKYRLDNGNEIEYWGSNRSAPKTISVSSAIHKVKVLGRRSGVTWGTSNEVTWDCRIPEINNLTITPINNTQGTLTFNTNFNVRYYINNIYIGTGNGNITTNIQLTENSLKTYTLRIERVDNTVIQNSKSINVDTRYSNISLSAYVSGLDVSFSITSSEICKNWYILYTWTDSTGTHSQRYDAPQGFTGKTWQGVLSTLTPNITYNITAYGTRIDNNAEGYSNTVIVTPTGCVRIFDKISQEYKPIGVYIFTEGSWKVAIPYIFTNGSWEMCQ